MDMPLRDRLAGRAFLFEHPDSYLAGVDAAIHALKQQRRVALPSKPPPSEP